MEFDLHGTTDHNGSLASPSWLPQADGRLPPLTDFCNTSPSNRRCTSQRPSVDEAKIPYSLICALQEGESEIKGHVNWAVASSVGEVLWLNFATDGDYNFVFFPDGDRGLTENNLESNDLTEPPNQRFIESRVRFPGDCGPLWN